MTLDSRESWLLNRRNFIGSSDAAVLWGCGYASQSMYSLYCEKALGQSWQPSKSELRRLRRGQLLEPYIREIAAEELGVDLHVDPPHSFRVRGVAAASLDSWYTSDCYTIPCELKHVGPHNASEWDDGPLPLKYQVQAGHQMMVLDAPYGYVCGLCDDELFVRRVERDMEWEALHAERCEEFMARVRGELPKPEPDGSPATTDAIKARWRRERTPPIEGPADVDEWTREIERLNEEGKEAERQGDLLRNRLREVIGEASGVISPSGVEWRWAMQCTRKAKHCPQCQCEVSPASESRKLQRVGKRKGAR